MPKALIVDDEDSYRIILRDFLEQKGYEVEEASNGIEAVALFSRNPPDILILDIFMPEKDGIETLIELRKKHPEAKVIAISGKCDGVIRNYLKSAELLGATGIFDKSSGIENLLESIRECEAGQCGVPLPRSSTRDNNG